LWSAVHHFVVCCTPLCGLLYQFMGCCTPLCGLLCTTLWSAVHHFTGTGQSCLDGIMRATSLFIAGKTVVSVGYGRCTISADAIYVARSCPPVGPLARLLVCLFAPTWVHQHLPPSHQSPRSGAAAVRLLHPPSQLSEEVQRDHSVIAAVATRNGRWN
jgi:hypothetical protein